MATPWCIAAAIQLVFSLLDMEYESLVPRKRRLAQAGSFVQLLSTMYGNDPTERSGMTPFGAIWVVVVLMVMLVASTALVASGKAMSRLEPVPSNSTESTSP